MEFPPPYAGDSERRDVRYGSVADITPAFAEVRLVPVTDIPG
jgi:hypothetical protein